MRAIALVPLLVALTPRGPHGPIGDMASSGNGLRTLPRHLPALDAPVFRRDEIQSPWSSRPPRGEILISPNRSTIVGITSTDVPHEFERSPARQLAEITTAFRQLLRESAQFDQLGGRLAGLADNNSTNSSISLEWAVEAATSPPRSSFRPLDTHVTSPTHSDPPPARALRLTAP